MHMITSQFRQEEEAKEEKCMLSRRYYYYTVRIYIFKRSKTRKKGKERKREKMVEFGT